MTMINEDIILELSQYLDIFTALCLAHSCGAAFRASQVYSYWHPHELPPFLGLAAFLPDDHVGPWRSYRGDEIRKAAIKMRDLRSRWESEKVSASHRVNVGRYISLEGIPGSRWLCALQNGRNGVEILRVVDGKTGISTIQDLGLDPIASLYRHQCIGYSLEPNRILIGCAKENDDEEVWGFELFEILLSVNENDGHPYIEARSTRIHLWENMPASPMAFTIPEFFVIKSDHDTYWSIWDLYVYHIPSMRHWEWREKAPRYNMSLVDQWCILTRNRAEMTRIIAIHLPSLLSLPSPTSHSLIPPNSTDLRTDEENAGVHYFVDIMPSRDSVSRYEGTSEYTVILSRYSRRFAFDIRIDVVPGSIYGNIVWRGTRLPLPTNRQLEERVSSQFPGSAADTSDPFMFVATQRDFEVLIMGRGSENCIKIMRMTNLCTSDHIRTLSWKAPLRSSTGATAAAEIDCQDDPDEVPYWDPGTGMLLLRGPPLSDGLQAYQICWF